MALILRAKRGLQVREGLALTTVLSDATDMIAVEELALLVNPGAELITDCQVHVLLV